MFYNSFHCQIIAIPPSVLLCLESSSSHIKAFTEFCFLCHPHFPAGERVSSLGREVLLIQSSFTISAQMWRRNALRFGNHAQENQDSDQSISEEEEGLEGDWTGNTVSLGGVGDNKGAMQVLSQLETLRDSYELQSTEKESITSHERKGGYHIGDEVEIPLFTEGDGSSHCPIIASATHTHSNEGITYLPNMASMSHSDEEIIFDDEKINPHTLRSARENPGGTWSEASREVEALVWLNENSSCSSSHGVFVKDKESSKGGGGRKKAKPKFLFRFHSRKKDHSLVVSDRNGRASSNHIPLPDEIGAAADEDVDNFLPESQLIFHDKESEQPENHIVPFELAHKHDFKHSMAEFLYCYEEKSDLQQGSSELEIKKRGRRGQMVLKRNTSPLGDRNLDDDDLPEALDSEPPFRSDDEENPHSLKPIIPGRTMADQFHEAFGMVSVIDERPHVAFHRPLCGIYGKLQQVMRSEKERDMDYFNNISAETGFKDEIMCISARILSRSLEAKLIVCSCTFVGDGKNSYWENNLQMKMNGVARTLTIIFNPRLCSDVELEVGNLIRIHPPWKEVQFKGKDEVIFLCSYFAQVQP
ncbi:hypothetical protein Pfo_006181 [Paulownia fortunei]|nr:hypothetical protein Pfo_006181 [Paulownia fortunei]